MKAELRELQSYWGCIPMQYYTHDFYKADCLLTLEEMKKFIPGYFFYFILYPRFDNVSSAEVVLENKIACSYLFSGLKLPTTNMIALKKGEHIYERNGRKLSLNDFKRTVDSTGSEKIFIKPVSGRGGTGIKVLNKTSAGYDSEGECFDFDGVSALPGDYVIETQLEQAAYINEVYPHSVNTLRVVTARQDSGDIALVAVSLRLGSDGRQVDNSTQGGMLIGIDAETGLPYRPYAEFEYGSEKVFNHPDTGYEFKKFQVKNWVSVKESIIDIAEKMVLYNLIGWDIALTDEGPVVIEANTKFGIDHSQVGTGGLRDFFISGSPKSYLLN
jgi:hypothetical protein